VRSEPISTALFSRNRAKLLARIEPGNLVIVSSNLQVIRSGDQFHPYRQHSDFFYLGGISQPGTVLVLASGYEILFIREGDEKTLVWSGPLLSREQASELSGIKDVRGLSELEGTLKKMSGEYERILYNGPATGLLEDCFPGKPADSLAELMTGLRMIKEPEEIEEIRKACKITASAFFRMLGHLEPGVDEYLLEAELLAGMLSSGARGHAF